jgi:hypothetical protein
MITIIAIALIIIATALLPQAIVVVSAFAEILLDAAKNNRAKLTVLFVIFILMIVGIILFINSTFRGIFSILSIIILSICFIYYGYTWLTTKRFGSIIIGIIVSLLILSAIIASIAAMYNTDSATLTMWLGLTFPIFLLIGSFGYSVWKGYKS